MRAFPKLLSGAAAVAALAGAAAPAAAQYYPYPYGSPAPYETPAPYGYPPAGGYGYGANTQQSLAQCAGAVARRINGGYSPNGWDGDYGRYGTGHVVGIHSVEPIAGGLRIRGVANSGMATYPYGAYAPGGYASQMPDLRFTCDVDYRGYIMNLDVRGNRGYGGYSWTPYTPGYPE